MERPRADQARAVTPARRRGLSLAPLVAATYFMVSGGPYGLEELVAAAGYKRAIVVLLVTPLVWSVPTALMVGELAAAIPEEGGYYAWVRRALGPFWGFLDAWLALAASVFDMALYPVLFAEYISRAVPAWSSPQARVALGCAMIVACALWNLRGTRAVAGGALILGVAMVGPFAAMVGLAAAHPSPPAVHDGHHSVSLFGGILVAMWNTMGWDNASTIAGEVERPQRTYPIAIFSAVGLVIVSYVLPVLAAARTGLDPSQWTTGSWVVAAEVLGGRPLAWLVVVGGAVCGLGVFNALVLSYSRIPMVLARDGFFPKPFAYVSPKTGVPVVSVVVCCVLYAACLGIGFRRLVELDIVLDGVALALEFLAFLVLRVREPDLPRPFRVPGGFLVACVVAALPLALLVVAFATTDDGEGQLHGWIVALAFVLLATLVYRATARRRAELG